ncbi:glycosyltransferase family 39 protein, partial [bacterium]|nr:glycosyltransferase family 39 protein [bacterium]
MKQINQHSASFLIIGLSVLLITAYILREKGFENGERTTFDEDLYAYMAYEMTVDIRHYNAINFSSLIRQHSPNRFLPDYLWKKLFKHPPFYSYLIVLSYKLHKELGYPITDQPQARHQAVRVSNCMGVLGILIIFLLGFYIFDWRVGVLAALFLAIDPVHWICSQKIWMETTLMTVMMASGLFYIMSYKYEKRKILFLILSGCCAGTA